MGASRDLGIGAGKGDASRIDDQQTFAENLGEVKFDGVAGMRRIGAAKFVKTYGKPSPPPEIFAETDGEWQPLGSIHQTATPPTNDICRD